MIVIFFKVKDMHIDGRKSFILRATHTYTHTHSKPDDTKIVISSVKFKMENIWCEAFFFSL